MNNIAACIQHPGFDLHFIDQNVYNKLDIQRLLVGRLLNGLMEFLK